MKSRKTTWWPRRSNPLSHCRMHMVCPPRLLSGDQTMSCTTISVAIACRGRERRGSGPAPSVQVRREGAAARIGCARQIAPFDHVVIGGTGVIGIAVLAANLLVRVLQSIAARDFRDVRRV